MDKGTSLEDVIRDYDELIEKTLGVVGAAKIYPKVFVKAEEKYLHPFFDRNLFNSLNQLDLVIGLKYLDIARGTKRFHEARYFAKVVATTSYEILRDLNQLVGKEIGSFISERLGAEALTDLDSSVREVAKIKKAYAESLGKIRHELLGHKLTNGLEQSKQLEALNIKTIYTVGKRIFYAQNKVLLNMTELIHRI